MRVLVYKRTHRGDPDMNGSFGVHDCMGTVRNRDFEAVVGVGGIGSDAQACNIAGKVNWIGIGPRKHAVAGKRGMVVTFDHFLDYDTQGPDFRLLAPILAERMYGKNIRSILWRLTVLEKREVLKIVRRAAYSPPSGSKGIALILTGTGKCGTRKLAHKTPQCSGGCS